MRSAPPREEPYTPRHYAAPASRHVDATGRNREKSFAPREYTFSAAPDGGGAIGTDDIAVAVRAAVEDRPVIVQPFAAVVERRELAFSPSARFLGSDGGGGIGAGPGIAVGAALALRGSGRLSIAMCGDGDYLMGATALWTATHYKIPLLLIVANNRSFYNDEVHQERVARMRERPVENKWIGQRIADPDIDLAAIGRAQGAQAWGPIERSTTSPQRCRRPSASGARRQCCGGRRARAGGVHAGDERGPRSAARQRLIR